MRVADFLDPAYCTLFFQTVDNRLHGGVSRTLLFGKMFLNFAHRGTAKRPHRAHDFQLQTRQSYRLFFDHPGSFTTNEVEATTIVVELSIEENGVGGKRDRLILECGDLSPLWSVAA